MWISLWELMRIKSECVDCPREPLYIRHRQPTLIFIFVIQGCIFCQNL